MSVFPKPYADLVARLRVSFGFVLVIAFAWLSQPIAGLDGDRPSGLGARIAAARLGDGPPGKEHPVSGKRAVRLRTESSVPGHAHVAAGLVIAARRWPLAFLFAAVFALVYLPVIELEEQHLRKLFPAFAEYSKRVPALWPTLHTLQATHKFRWDLYVRNREYQALLGFVAGEVFLAAKMILALGSAPS